MIATRKAKSKPAKALFFGQEDNKMKNYIYKITNLINQKYYIGKRHTKSNDPLNDGYWGSGKLIKAAIKKYGLSNFKKEILEICDTVEELNQREAEIVNLDIVKDPMSYNMQCGGDVGGSTRKSFVG